jgi:hypothetical protein
MPTRKVSRRIPLKIKAAVQTYLMRHYERLQFVIHKEDGEWTTIEGSPKAIEIAEAIEYGWAECKAAVLDGWAECKAAVLDLFISGHPSSATQFDQDGCVKLSDNGYIEPPSVEDPAIRRCDVHGNTEEVRNPNDDGYEDWADLFGFRETVLAEIRKREPTYHERTACTIDSLLTDLAEMEDEAQ